MARLVCFGSAALALALAVLVIVQDGAAWRIPSERLYPSAEEMREEESALCTSTDVANGPAPDGGSGAPIVTCSYERGAAGDIYVWGDSHARHLLAGLVAAYPERNVHILYLTSCPAQSGSSGYEYAYEGRQALRRECLARNAKALDLFESIPPTTVVLHQYFGYEGQFSPAWYRATENIIAKLEESGHRVAFVGGVPRPGIALAQCLAVPPSITDDRLERRCVGDTSLSGMVLAHNAALAAEFPAHFVDVSGFFCSDAASCRAVRGNTLLFRDKHHLTVEGARGLVAHIEPRLSSLLGL